MGTLAKLDIRVWDLKKLLDRKSAEYTSRKIWKPSVVIKDLEFSSYSVNKTRLTLAGCDAVNEWKKSRDVVT